MGLGWSEERVELLKTLCFSGMSCSQMAGRLGGVTRNAVIGKLFRLGLSARSEGTRGKRSTQGAAPRPRHAARIARMDAKRRRSPESPIEKLLAEPFVRQAEPFIEPSQRKPILVRKDDGCLHANDELTDSCCRWPCGDVGEPDFGYCGKHKVPGLPYCEGHARLAFRATNPSLPGASRPAVEPVEPAKSDDLVAA